MKELQNKSKLIKGLIYDDPLLAEENVSKVATDISDILDHRELMEEYLNECKIQNPNDNTIPTPDEMIAYGIMFNMINPTKESRNFIIPSNMVDNKLYNELSKIDIGYDILNKFDDIRLDKMIKENENTDNKLKIHFINRDGKIINTLEFDNESEAADFIGKNFAVHTRKSPETYIGIAEQLFSKEF